ncbi:hypothetical protein TNCV_2190231 [Trichonephila clavipes]|uniref:Uncharacterized protein n=1 Tax=Trichonephila clavipes TaxID=2585209 RepID=A0A8X6R3J1_TRICX|nr:hypothetical protein TNCV_2190231 [Trichonephila clavipes]
MSQTTAPYGHGCADNNGCCKKLQQNEECGMPRYMNSSQKGHQIFCQLNIRHNWPPDSEITKRCRSGAITDECQEKCIAR